MYEYCAREASQILGGNSFLRSGVGEKVERLYREVRVNAIGGGSEEILYDLAMKQAKLWKAASLSRVNVLTYTQSDPSKLMG